MGIMNRSFFQAGRKNSEQTEEKKNNIVVNPNINQENIPPRVNNTNTQTISASPSFKREKPDLSAAGLWAEMSDRMQKLREGTQKLMESTTESEKKFWEPMSPKK